MKKILIFGILSLAGGLLIVTEGEAFPLWLDRPRHTNPVDTAFEKAPGAPGPTLSPTPSNKLDVYVRSSSWYLRQPISGARVMLGSDAAGALATDASGKASFSNVALPADVHVFSSLSTGAVAVYNPHVLSYYACNVTAVAFNSFNPVTWTGYTLSLCISGTAGTTSYFGGEYHLSGGGSASSSGPGQNACGIWVSGLLAGDQLNISMIGRNAAGTVNCIFFNPTYTMPAANASLSGQASTTAMSVTSLSINALSLATWPSQSLQLSAGYAGENLWRLDYFSGISSTPWIRSEAGPISGNHYRASLSGYQSGSPNSFAAQAYVDGSGPLPSSISLALPAAVAFGLPLPDNSQQVLHLSNPSSIAGTIAYAAVGQWTGYKPIASASPSADLSLPTAFPAGYPADFIALTGSSTQVAAGIIQPAPSFDPGDVESVTAPYFLQYSAVQRSVTW